MSINTIEIQDESGNIYYPRTVSGNVIMPSGEKLVTTIANVNMLDNSNFTKPVNQRGVAGVVSLAGYFIDRWKLVSGTATLTTTGINLSSGSKILQILEDKVAGQTTTSLGIISGIAAASYNNTSKTFTITAQSACEISWAKLEKGAVSTVYQKKGYGVELAECLRYFERIGDGAKTICNLGYGSIGSNWGLIFLQFSQKRITPTVTLPAANKVFAKFYPNDNVSNTTNVTVSSYETGDVTDAHFFGSAIYNRVIGNRGDMLLVPSTAGVPAYIDISADL